ncbi:MAG: putative DNA binding domain-containing protein [Candidatus Poribacteria bacterium]|nr:putative DNA binding domain-containing protein [Candidatus Poribacteria bacterium]
MPNLTDKELLQIIEDDEADRVEFKESLSGSAPKEIREAICAFANDLPHREKPGYVFVGVRNDKSIAGLTDTNELLRQLADMKTDGNIVPPPSLTVEKCVLGARQIALVTVQPSNSPPGRYKGVIHIRIGPRRGIATAQEESILNEKRRYGDIPFDVNPIPTAGISDLNLAQFENEYLPRVVPTEILEANERTPEERLAANKMTAPGDARIATVLGILVLGKNPQDFLPGAYVQFLKIDGGELTDDIVDSEEIHGAIPDLLRRLDDKLNAHNRIAVDITTSNVERRTSLYPMMAVQQITRNAVMHRSYEATNAPIRVSWFNDRIEVLSPGGAFGAVTTENFGHTGLTDYRNPNLAEAMKNLGFVQRYGMGIPIARMSLKAAGHPEPEFKLNGSYVLTTIKIARNPVRT